MKKTQPDLQVTEQKGAAAISFDEVFKTIQSTSVTLCGRKVFFGNYSFS